MIETDILYAYIKKDDWLKPVAKKLYQKLLMEKLAQFMLQEKRKTFMKHIIFQERKGSS